MKKSAKSAEESGKESVEKMRLIDADALFAEFENVGWYNNADRDEIAEPLILQSPTIDAVEVVRGEWIDEANECDASFGIHDYICSNCNHHADDHIGGHMWYTMYKPNYCQYCGARMKGADDD